MSSGGSRVAIALDTATLDRAVAAVRAHRNDWVAVPRAARIELLQRCIAGMVAVADEMAEAGCQAKGLDPNSPAGAEEWFSGPIPVIRNLRLLVEALAASERSGHPGVSPPGRRQPPRGMAAVRVFPRDGFDRVLYPRVNIDVWVGSARPRFITPSRHGSLVLVLAAGNVASIGLMDLLYKLFVENKVVVLKTHPINGYVASFVERAFCSLIDGGYLRVVSGDAAAGAYLVTHPGVDEIHLTGSAAVHDRIAAATDKPLTSELGCVTPVIVVPGEWSDQELDYHAENVATMVALNASCNCNAAKVLVTWRGWRHRDAFLDRIRRILSALPARLAYYPGSAAKYARFVGAAAGATSHLPFATLYDVDPSDHHASVFTEEAWSPVIAETALTAADPIAFTRAAVAFCNDHLAGTLSCVLLIDARARRSLAGVLDDAIRELRYGTVSINHWSAVSYALAVAPWGAYPGHTRDDVGSGIGVVHNTQMLADVVKTVLDAPFTTWPKPAWFVTHRRAGDLARRMVRFEAAPSWWRVPALAWAAYQA